MSIGLGSEAEVMATFGSMCVYTISTNGIIISAQAIFCASYTSANYSLLNRTLYIGSSIELFI